MTYTKINTAFAQDTQRGLSANPKYLCSKYFYDDRGSELFQNIMHMPEYYLTDCEYEIFSQQKESIGQAMIQNNSAFDLIELGAGDGYKTKVLIEHLLNKQASFKYIPIDISERAINSLVSEFKSLPQLVIDEKIGDYFKVMQEINAHDHRRKVILFLGSNIGNFTAKASLNFFQQLAAVMNERDSVFLGFDLKKDPHIISRAYDDPHGYTRDFNLNLLLRINNELGGNFELDQFMHYQIYEPRDGVSKSYLISRKKQTVTIRELDQSFAFDEWEPVFTEMSQKYDNNMIQKFAAASGFKVVANFYDSRTYFVNSLWQLDV